MVCISQASNQRAALKDVEVGKNSDGGETRTHACHVRMCTYLVGHVQNLRANDRACVNSSPLRHLSVLLSGWKLD